MSEINETESLEKKQKKNKTGKKSKISLIFVLVLSIGATILALNLIQLAVVATGLEVQVKEDDEEDYAAVLKGYCLSVEKDIEGYYRALEYYTKADAMRYGSITEMAEWLTAHETERHPDFDYIMLADRSGYSYNDIGSRTDISNRGYFKAIMEEGQDRYIDDPVISKTTGQPVIHITTAIKRNGKNIAMLCGVVNIKTITREVNEINVGEGYAWILASDGTVISHPREDFLMVKNFITGLSAGFEDMAAVATEVSQGHTGSAWIKGLNGGKDFVTYRGVYGTPWGMAMSIPDGQILAMVKKVRTLMIAFGVLVIIASIGIGALLVYRNIKPLAIVEDTINGIATGDADLTQRINVKAKFEIGRVVEGFNEFAEKLQTIISTMKKSKLELVGVGEMLQDSTEDTSAAITQIIGNIESMGKQVTFQSDSVHETVGAVNEIASNIESLNHMIEHQASAVTQASAAVEEMIGNINSVNTSVQKMGKAFEDLEKKAVMGVQRQNDVNEKIEEIEKESQALQEANAVISGIAEQTNLLAMNAAIEAAHAGEAGKGFSVVADEIRKLSEDSGSQSQTIGNQLSKITGSIEEIVAASQIATDAFNEVSTGINSTTNLVREITNAMLEQNEGSKQIAIALNSMNDTSNEVKTASYEMAEGNKQILNEIKHLQDSSFTMKSGMDEMTAGARKINETGAALYNLSNRMKNAIESIGEQVDQFKV